jgi:putative ABC transport system permease protein
MSGDRWFRVLLRMLPLDFRSDYGDEMARTFREQRAGARGRGVARLWWENIVALLSIGPREHAAQLRQDVRYAVRGMRRQPGFVAVVIATLALGIGANTAMFSIVHAVLLRPLPYGSPHRLVAVWNTWTGRTAAGLSDPEYLDYSERSRTIAIAAMSSTAVNVTSGAGDAERVQGAAMTVNGLQVLGVVPALGRGFLPDEERNGRDRAVLLSDGIWRRRFGASPAIVGSQIHVNGVPHVVAGVLPAGFLLPLDFLMDAPIEVVLPLALDRAAPRNRRGGHYLMGFGRLAPGATPETAAAEMQSILAPLMREYPEEHDQGDFAIAVRPLRDDLLGSSGAVLSTLAGAVGLVLLLACANVANLMLARGEARRRELAVRAALGASRLRVARQLLTESCVLAGLGAAAGLLVAFGTARAVVALGGSVFPRLGQAELNGVVVLFTAVLALGVGLLFGAIPAMQLSHAGAGETLKDGSRGTEGRSRVRRALVVCQVGLAVVLVIAAGLLIKSFVRLTRVPSGLDAANVLTMRISLPAARYPERTEIVSFYSRFTERVAALPGVRDAGAGSGLPLAVSSGDWSFDIEGRPRINTRRPGAADWYVVTPGYFEALNIQLVRGRLPAESDAEQAPPVVLVNEATARALFPSTDPIGKRVRLSQTTGAEQPWRTIVGVVGDVRQRGLDTAPRTEIYIPYRQFLHFSAGGQVRAMSLVIKADVAPESLVGAVRAELRAIDPEVPAAQVRTMDDVIAASVTDRRLNTLLIGTFGGLALALAAIGLYGVMAYSVTQRTREMGVRIAVGASRASVLALVVGQAVRLVAAGIVLGTAVALAAAETLASLLFDVEPRDPAILALAPVVLLAAGVLASYLPARRATRVDPVTALRAE